MKTIEQLVELSSNPYYSLSPEEKARLDDFLSKRSEQFTQQKNNGKSSEKNIPATVLNKNIVKKETGEIPTVDNVVSDEEKNSSQTRSKPL